MKDNRDNREKSELKGLIDETKRKDNEKQSDLPELQQYLAKINGSTLMKITKASLWSGGIALFLSKALEVFLGKSIVNEDTLNKIEIITVFGMAAFLLVAWFILDIKSKQQCTQKIAQESLQKSEQENEKPSSHLSNVTSCAISCDKEIQTDFSCFALQLT